MPRSPLAAGTPETGRRLRLLALALAGLALASAVPASAQTPDAAGAGPPAGPRQLFPDLSPEEPSEDTPPDDPAPETVETAPVPAVVGVTALAPPGLGAVGLPRAAEGLGAAGGRPLWGPEAPEGLAAALARLPARVEDATLRRLQRDLLLAPGPRTGAGEDVLTARVGRLLAMGESQAAAELLGQVPDPGSAALAPTRAAALLAADRVEPACALVDRSPGDGGGGDSDRFWAEARLVCAALRGDPARLTLGLSLLAEQGRPAGPLLSSLLLASGGGTGQPPVTLREAPPPDDPLLLPLLRRVPLRPERAALANAAPPVVQAVAQNPTVPAALAPPAAGPPPSGPPLPGVDGRSPPVADWAAALESVPAARRARWLAALDGLGAGPPEAVLAGLPEAARVVSTGRIDLAAWGGLERATAAREGPRGPVLLQALLLLDGRPREAAPLALRAALAALRGIGLEPAAREVAASALAAGDG